MEMIDVEFDVCPFCGEDLSKMKTGAGQTASEVCRAAAPQPPAAPPVPPAPAVAPPPYNGAYSQNDIQNGASNLEPGGFFRTFAGREFFGRYANFNEVTPRRDFWMTVLCMAVIQFGLYGLCGLVIGAAPVEGLIITWVLCAVIGIAFFIPTLALYVRRLRDADKSPWLLLLGLIPVAGPIILLVFFCQKGYYPHREFNFTVADGIVTAICFVLFFAGVYSAFNSISKVNRYLNGSMDVPEIEDVAIPKVEDYYSERRESVPVGEEEAVEVIEEATEATRADVSGTYVLEGTVAGTPVIMEILVNGGTVEGRYRYAKINPPSWLDINGYFSDGYMFTFIETNAAGEMTGDYDCEGVFDSRGKLKGIKGTMTNYKGKTYKVNLSVR